MYKNVCNPYAIGKILLIISCFGWYNALAQLSVTGQLKNRGELRNGYGTLSPIGNKSAGFVSQRTRLSLNYKNSNLIFQASLQDVRLWGQDASTISINDGNRLGVHEAWAELILSNKKDTSFKSSPVDYFTIKVGRQEISYDDERLLGASDWLQQARRHDALVLKLQQAGWQLDVGLAFNQNSEAINYNGTYYTPANVPATVRDSKGNIANTPAGFIPLVNAAGLSSKTGSPAYLNPLGTNGLNQNYKSLQYLYAAKKISKTRISFLFLADQFGKYKLDSVKNVSGTDEGYIYGKRFNQDGVNTRYTTGLLVNPAFGDKNKWGVKAGFYYQGGHDRDGLELSAYTYTAALSYKSKNLEYITGWDYLSGNNALSASTTNHRFDPLYGTPHKFWGYMDYFYAGSGSPTGGLSNPYLKIKYLSGNKRLSTELASHYFMLASNQTESDGQPINKHLGTEFDLVSNYKLNNFTAVEMGLSYMVATHSMEYAKGITPGANKLHPMWAYLQLNIKPEFLK